uniref:RING-type domain-containing protein n=1 Tax=viral metagenome TaxID=1070528 RepID=A0A6C0C9U3_9ZZZZ
MANKFVSKETNEWFRKNNAPKFTMISIDHHKIVISFSCRNNIHIIYPKKYPKVNIGFIIFEKSALSVPKLKFVEDTQNKFLEKEGSVSQILSYLLSSSEQKKSTRKLSPYNIFVQNNMSAIKKRYPEMNQREIMRGPMSDAWKKEKDKKIILHDEESDSIITKRISLENPDREDVTTSPDCSRTKYEDLSKIEKSDDFMQELTDKYQKNDTIAICETKEWFITKCYFDFSLAGFGYNKIIISLLFDDIEHIIQIKYSQNYVENKKIDKIVEISQTGVEKLEFIQNIQVENVSISKLLSLLRKYLDDAQNIKQTNTNLDLLGNYLTGKSCLISKEIKHGWEDQLATIFPNTFENKNDHHKINLKNKECAICYEIINETYVLVPCGHTSICIDCLSGHRMKKECPICKNKIEKFIKIYD